MHVFIKVSLLTSRNINDFVFPYSCKTINHTPKDFFLFLISSKQGKIILIPHFFKSTLSPLPNPCTYACPHLSHNHFDLQYNSLDISVRSKKVQEHSVCYIGHVHHTTCICQRYNFGDARPSARHLQMEEREVINQSNDCFEGCSS